MSVRCYVLGAGFSKPFGFPLASELTSLVWNHAAEAVGDFRPDVRDGWLTLLKTTYPSCDFKSTWPDFEDLITVLEEWEAYCASYGGDAAQPENSERAHLSAVLLKHLGLLLCERLSACDSVLLTVVRQFVQNVTQACHFIISFNWDLLLEAAAAEAGVPVSYDMVTEGARLQLAKPHGSLNLAEMSPDEWANHRTSLNVHSVSEEFKREDTVVIRADDPRDAANRVIGPFGKTLLVEPTVRKSYKSQWLDLQWRCAMNMARTAEEIVIIGYSLPLTDFRPRILLQLAGLGRDRKPRFRIVDPFPETLRDRYARFISDPMETVATDWREWFQGAVTNE